MELQGARGNGENFDLIPCMNGAERDLMDEMLTPSVDLNSEAPRGSENGEELDLTLSLKAKFGVDPARRSTVRVSDAAAENGGGAGAHQEYGGSLGAARSSRTIGGAGNNPGGGQSVSLEIDKQPSVVRAAGPIDIANGGKETYENFSNILEMPLVSTRWPGVDGEKVKGFLYKYKKVNEICIVCMCHGHFFSPAEFVRHGGGGDVEEPLKHILIICEGISQFKSLTCRESKFD